ncbi:MAG: methyltransferase domain-containing protein [Holophagaceae bacterium]|nr:methyltransferase domain-containing protein [Holophagaceae bacterium]
MPAPEHWPSVYRDRPEIFAAFARAEDPQGRIVARLAELANLEGTTALELGCGTGRYTTELAQRCARYLATDPSPALLELAKRDGAAPWLLRTRAERLPLKDHCVDRVLATWVLAYLRPGDRAAALAEAARVLRPGGSMWLVENHWDGEFQELRDRAGYGAEPGVKALIEAGGFRVAARIESELRFDSNEEAAAILGALCGETVAEKLRRAPRRSFGHEVVILQRAAGP